MMKYALKYLKAVGYKKLIFDLLEEYANNFNAKPENKGYVQIFHRNENSLDLSIGSEKFTILATIDKFGVIIFDVYGWEFDISSPTRYSHLKINKLTFFKSENSLSFKYKHILDIHENYQYILDLTSDYDHTKIGDIFNVLEDYISKKRFYQDSDLKITS